jgi:hypothetical protein
MFKTMAAHVPPSPLMSPPTRWGAEATVQERMGDSVADLHLTRRLYPFKYPFSVAEVVEFFRKYYGPTNRAFSALDADRQAALRYDLEQLWAHHNQSGNGGVHVESEYLEVQAVRRS